MSNPKQEHKIKASKCSKRCETQTNIRSGDQSFDRHLAIGSNKLLSFFSPPDTFECEQQKKEER